MAHLYEGYLGTWRTATPRELGLLSNEDAVWQHKHGTMSTVVIVVSRWVMPLWLTASIGQSGI